MDNGVYTIAVRVTDDDGSSDLASMTVTVNDLGPTAVLSGDTNLVEASPGAYDASASTSSPDAIVSYDWDWNYNGTAFAPSGDTGSVQTHTWQSDGQYTIAVRVTDDDGSTDIASLEVTVADLGGPEANLTGDTSLNEGSTGNYDATGSSVPLGTIDLYEWDWDYAGVSFTPSADTGALQSHTWPDNGIYTIAVRVTDNEGETDIASLSVTVNNVAPAVDAGPDGVIDEGSAFVSTGAFSDPGSDTWTATVDYGDGSGVQPLALNPDKTFGLSHTYTDDGVYTVTVSVTDDDGGTGADTAQVTVGNVVPAVDAGPDGVIDEGSVFVSTGSFSDPGADTWTATVDYGDGSGVQPLALNPDKTFGLSHTYTDDGVYTVTVSVTDDDGGTGADTAQVTVGNVVPAVDAGPDGVIDEGSVFVSTGSFSDPGADTWTATVDYGDGSGVQPLALNPDKTFGLSHTYTDDGVYTVTVSVTDDDGGTGMDTAQVTVGNVVPAVDAGPDGVIDEGSVFVSTGSFSDPGADTWTATVDYGDGSGVQPLALNPDKTFSLSHTYTDDGVYTVTVSVTDDDGGTGTDTAQVTVNASQIPGVTDLYVRAKSGKTNLVWSHVGGVSYNIYRSADGSAYELIGNKLVPGDMDGDGDIDGADLTIFNVSFGSQVGDTNYNILADINRDNVVDSADLYLISNPFGGDVGTMKLVYADYGLTNGITYCYKVRSVNAAGQEFTDSNAACATPMDR